MLKSCNVSLTPAGTVYRGFPDIIAEEKLKEDETKKFVDNAIADGEMRTTGTDIDKLMPPNSRFGSTNREKKNRRLSKN